MEDREVVERIRQGDVDAFSILVDKYHRGLLAFIWRVTGNRETVEDIGQDVFLEVYRSLRDFDENRGTPFSVWLFAIARNRCVSELRKRKGIKAVSMEEAIELAAALKSAEEELMEQEAWRAIRTSLEQLEAPFRSAMEMSLGGSSLKEIAAMCGISLGTAKSRLSRAREKMKLLVRSCLGGGKYERI